MTARKILNCVSISRIDPVMSKPNLQFQEGFRNLVLIVSCEILDTVI